jgi:hypothetical protein
MSINEESKMDERKVSAGKHLWISMLGVASLLAGGSAWAQEKEPDQNLSAWLGEEFTIDSPSNGDFMPNGGKLTFTYDKSKDVVHLCTRPVADQEGAWKMDLSKPCGVTMTFTAGTKYCTEEDVKAGNAEVLASCHRLRARDVSLRPAQAKGAVELNDMVAFLVKHADGKRSMTIFIDSPARMTDGNIIRTRRQ